MKDIVDVGFSAREVGQPVVWIGERGKTYGRIVELDGTPLEGQYPILTFCTPHGSSVKSGILGAVVFTKSYFAEPSEDDLARLRAFEQDALRKGEWYDGRLPKPDLDLHPCTE